MKSHLYEDKEKFVEMSNLGSRLTGLDGSVYISTKEGNHGPRIKFYKKLGKDKPYTGVSISDDPKILYDDLILPPKEQQKLLKFVKLNHELLSEFWYNGHYIDFENILDRLKKV